MSRSGYSDDLDSWDLVRWRGAVASAIRGKRGQALLRDLAAALDAMPEKRLIARQLEEDGEVCALGALGRVRGIDMSKIDPEERDQVAKAFDIAEALAAEIVYHNDECGWTGYPGETPENRWVRMRAWVAEKLAKESER